MQGGHHPAIPGEYWIAWNSFPGDAGFRKHLIVAQRLHCYGRRHCHEPNY
jgi:hypothetical protein